MNEKIMRKEDKETDKEEKNEQNVKMMHIRKRRNWR